MISPESIGKAHSAIRPHVYRTPLIYSDSLSRLTGASVYIKCENLQKTGSFKVRGAFNKLLKLKEAAGTRAAGPVIAASMGNHAQGVAYAATTLGIGSKIIMPKGVSAVKEEAVRAYGAEVVLHGESLKEALGFASIQKGYVFVHPFDDEAIIEGQGTIGLEIIEEHRGFDYIICPVGGGGLISGIAVAVKEASPQTKIIGVQAEAATSALESFKKKKIVERPPSATIADGIAVGKVGSIALDIMSKHVDDVMSVPEGPIAHAILLFLERKKLVVEGAGAAPLALCLHNPGKFKGKRVVLVASGGNIDFTIVDRIIHRGLAAGGRIGLFEAVIEDNPGALHLLTGAVSAKRANIISIFHDRLSPDVPVGRTKVRVEVEVKNRGHFEDIICGVKAAGIEAEEPK